jgi:hypothetical protein
LANVRKNVPYALIGFPQNKTYVKGQDNTRQHRRQGNQERSDWIAGESLDSSRILLKLRCNLSDATLIEKSNLLAYQGVECIVPHASAQSLGRIAEAPKHQNVSNETNNDENGPITRDIIRTVPHAFRYGFLVTITTRKAYLFLQCGQTFVGASEDGLVKKLNCFYGKSKLRNY